MNTASHDVFPPSKDAPHGALSIGWTYDLKRIKVMKACSTKSAHGVGTWEVVDKPHAIMMFSSAIRAAYGMRNAILIKHRMELEKVDKYIRKLENESSEKFD